MSKLHELLTFVSKHHGINDKERLIELIRKKFALTQDRKVFYCKDFSIRFSKGTGTNFANTILSLSNLKKVDDIPFLVCLITPSENRIFLANSTFLRKISHSSHELREDNIKGSFNGSDIIRELEGISNEPANIERLFAIHHEIGFEENLPRLVEATNNITPIGHKFIVSPEAKDRIIDAPVRAAKFVASQNALTLKSELDAQVEKFKSEILVASMIENVNVRGRIIEYLIAGKNETMHKHLVAALQNKKSIPAFKTENTIGDYQRIFDEFHTETDVKTKIMILESNPKAYNLDKILEFLATEKSVFLFYFIGVDTDKIVNTALVSMFQTDILANTILLKHWSGRNSRGVSQIEEKAIAKLIHNPKSDVNTEDAIAFLKQLIEL